MRILASLLIGLITASIFASISDSLVLAIRDLFHLDLDIEIYSIMASTRNLGACVSFILGGLAGYFLLGIYQRSESKGFRRFFAVLLFLICMVLTTGLSIVLALAGASLAGVRDGGFGWQYLYAIYGGGIIGFLGFFLAYSISWSAKQNAVFAFVTTSLLVPALVFLLSIGGHTTLIASQKSRTSASSEPR